MNLESQSDEQLMVDYANGNAAAFEELFRRYGQRLYNLFLRSVRRPDWAEDLLQECFLRVIEARQRYQPRNAFSSWIYTIAMNLVRDRYRSLARRGNPAGSEDSDSNSAVTPSAAERPDEYVAVNQAAAAVADAVNALPPEQREVILLSKYQGLSFAQIAAVLNTTPEAAKQKAYRAMQTLRKKLAFLKEE